MMNNDSPQAQAKETCLVYVTAADAEEAERIARTVVDEHLAACANIFGKMKSIYRWEGKVCVDEEVSLILKTSARRQDELIGRVRELHSYECPCVVCMPVVAGNPDFLNWIDENTREQ